MNFNQVFQFVNFKFTLTCIWCAYYLITIDNEINMLESMTNIHELPIHSQTIINGTSFYSFKQLEQFEWNGIVWTIIIQICFTIMLLFISYNKEIHERLMFILIRNNRIRMDSNTKQYHVTTGNTGNTSKDITPEKDLTEQLKGEIEMNHLETPNAIHNSEFIDSGDHLSQMEECHTETESSVDINVGPLISMIQRNQSKRQYTPTECKITESNSNSNSNSKESV